MAQDQEIVFRLAAKNLTSAEFAKARKDLLGVGDSAKKAQASMSPLGGAVKNASSEFARMNPATARLSSVMGGASIATLGAVGALGGLAAAASAGIGHVIALGDQITTLSSKTGLSTTFLQELNHAADQLDVPFDSAANAVSKLQVNIGKVKPSSETLDALRSMGLSIEELRRLAPEQQFQRVADSLSVVNNQSLLAANAQALFGRGGLELIPLLKGNYAELAGEAHNLGLVLDKELLEAGDELGEHWILLKKRGASLLGEAVSPLVVKLNELLGIMNSPIDDRSFISKLATLPSQLIARAFGQINTDAQAAFDADVARSLKIERELEAQARRNLEAEKKKAKAVEETAKVVGRRLQEEIHLRAELEKQITKQLGRIGRPGTRTLEEAVPLAPTGIAGDLLDEVNANIEATERWEEAQRQYNEALAAANDIAQLFGGTLGSIVGQTLGAVSSLQSLSSLGGEGGILGGLKGAFSGGKGDAGGIAGVLGGLASAASFVAPFLNVGIAAGKLIFKGLKGLFGGRDGEDAAKEIARDLGATVNKELADQIANTGRPVQLAVADIFKSGGFGDDVDRFAEEIGDLFSFRARGDITESELFTSLEEALPLLKERFAELGPAGEEQIQRIAAAAEQAGIDLKALGFDVEQLQAQLGAGFAPQTLEELQETLGLTSDEVRALGEELGLNIQTNLERMAAGIGVSVDEFRALQDAAAAALDKDNISAEEFLKFLEATGLSAEQLAEKLGISVAGTEDVGSAQAQANEETQRGLDLMTQFADQAERAAGALRGVSIPSGGGGQGFAEGTPGGDFMNFGPGTAAVLHGKEAVIPQSGVGDLAKQLVAAGGAGGGTVVNNVSVEFVGGILMADDFAYKQDLAKRIAEIFRDNTAYVQSTLRPQTKNIT